MELKEQLKPAIDKLKSLIQKFEAAPVVEPVKLMDAVLKDGSKIQIEGDLKPGSKVMVSGDAGATPAPDGEHELQDGTKVTTQAGVIIEIVPPGDGGDKPAAPAADPAKMSAEVENKFNEALQTISALTERVVALESALKVSGQEMSSVKEVQKSTFSIVEKLAAMPSEKPTEKKKNLFVKATTEDKLEMIAKNIQDLKK